CGPGVAWTAWLRRQLTAAKAVDPEQKYRQALETWREQAAGFEDAELGRLSHLPEWGSVHRPAARLDVFGGTLAGWQSLLAVHGTSILAGQPLLVADLTGQRAADHLTALAQQAGISGASYLLPEDLDASGLLTRLDPGQLAGALAEAIHAGSDGGARTERAIDVRVLEQLTGALGGHVTMWRIAAAARAALGQPVPPGLLTGPEQEVISGPLFPDGYRTQVAGSLVRLDAFLSDLASWTGSGPAAVPPPAWYSCLAVSPSAVSDRNEVLTALIIQWLTVQVTASTAHTPAVILAGPDDITRAHLERLAAACERNRVPLTVLFRHLRDDALGFLGGGATAFMRLGNHAEAEQAASYIGRHHRFVVSQFTATRGGSRTTTRADTYGWGSSESRGSNTTHGWSEEHLGAHSTSGSSTRSQDRSTSQNWSQSMSWADGTSWSDAVGVQRVYEYAVEPSVLQSLPDNVLLVPTSAGQVQAVECDPEIVTLPRVSAVPLSEAAPRGWEAAGPGTERPQIAPRPFQARWPQQPANP